MILVKSRIVAAALLATVLVVSSQARAEAPASTESARGHYQRGKTHYQLAEYKEALEAFRAAYRLKQDPVFLFNIAQCHRQLDQHAEALKLYGAYLRESPNAVNRAEVEKRMAELQQELELERKKAEEAEKKKAEEAAAATERQRLEDERRKAEEATAAAERRRLEDEKKKAEEAAAAGAKQPALPAAVVPSRPNTGELEVVAAPSDAVVLLNRMQVGTGAMTRVRLPPGLYTVTVQKDGYRAAEVGASLFGGERTRIETDLQRLKSHGWRWLGHFLVVLTLASESAAMVSRVNGQDEFEGSPDFKDDARAEKIFQAGAITFGTLAVGSYVLDWYRNRNRADEGAPALITNVSRGAL